MEKANFLLREIAEQVPGLGLIDIDDEDLSFESQKELIWNWFRVVITDPMNLKSGTLLYVYADSEDFFELKTEPDYELVNEDGDEIKLYWI